MGRYALILVGAFAPALLLPAGCFRHVKEERLQRIELRTDPPGAMIITRDDEQGVRHRGPAPVVIEQRQTVTVKRFRQWHWVWPGLFTVGAAVGLGLSSSKEREGQAAAITTLSLLGLVITTVADIFGVLESGKVASATPDVLVVRVQRQGGEVQTHRVPLPSGKRPPGETWSSTIRLETPQLASPRTAPPPPLRRGALLAVFALLDQTGELGAGELATLDARLLGELSSRALRLVAREQLLASLPAGAGERRCFPGTCQIEVGRSLGAELALSTRVLRAGASCALVATVVDLRTTSSVRDASAPAGCSLPELLGATSAIARQLGQPR